MSKERRMRYPGGNRRTLYCAPNIELFPSLKSTSSLFVPLSRCSSGTPFACSPCAAKCTSEQIQSNRDLDFFETENCTSCKTLRTTCASVLDVTKLSRLRL